MTRAAERLVVCGTKGINKIPDGCWHQLVRNALEPLSVKAPADGGGEVLHFRKGEPPAMVAAANQSDATIALPAWLTRNVPPDKVAEPRVTPSAGGEDGDIRPRPAARP